jgi:hypothetical protein
MSPRRGSTPRRTGWLTVSRNVTLTLTKTLIAGQPLGWPRKSKIGRWLDSSPEKPPASTLHRRNHLRRLFTGETTCLDSSPEKPTMGRWHGTRRQLAYRPSSAAGPALARHTPPARLPAFIGRCPSSGTAHAASSPTGLHQPLSHHWHGTRRQLAHRHTS